MAIEDFLHILQASLPYDALQRLLLSEAFLDQDILRRGQVFHLFDDLLFQFLQTALGQLLFISRPDLVHVVVRKRLIQPGKETSEMPVRSAVIQSQRDAAASQDAMPLPQ